MGIGRRRTERGTARIRRRSKEKMKNSKVEKLLNSAITLLFIVSSHFTNGAVERATEKEVGK